MIARYEPIIGLDVSVQLATRTKIFCSCPTSFGAQPDTNVCPVCLGRKRIRSGLDGMIRVRLNGQLVAEHPGDPARVRSGPIGLQLHDPQSIVMFRNIRVREVTTSSK